MVFCSLFLLPPLCLLWLSFFSLCLALFLGAGMHVLPHVNEGSECALRCTFTSQKKSQTSLLHKSMCVFDCHGTGIPPCSWLHRGSRNQHLSHWTNSLSFGLDFRRLKLDVHVFPHKGILKARKRTLHRTA